MQNVRDALPQSGTKMVSALTTEGQKATATVKFFLPEVREFGNLGQQRTSFNRMAVGNCS